MHCLSDPKAVAAVELSRYGKGYESVASGKHEEEEAVCGGRAFAKCVPFALDTWPSKHGLHIADTGIADREAKIQQLQSQLAAKSAELTSMTARIPAKAETARVGRRHVAHLGRL